MYDLRRIFDVYTDAGLPATDAGTLADNALRAVFFVAGVLALYFLTTAAFKYVTSGGNPEKAKQATQTIIFAAVGLFIILTSFILMTWVFRIGS